MAIAPSSRFEPRRFVAAELHSWQDRLSTAVRWASLWSFLKILSGFATGGWALAADGLAAGAELLAVFITGLGQNRNSDRTGRFMLRGLAAALTLVTGIIVLRMGFGRIMQPVAMQPVSYLILSCAVMAGQFITARYVSSSRQMAIGHVPVYRILAGSVLSSVFITLTAAACSYPAWREADAVLVLAIGVVTLIRSAAALRDLIQDMLGAPEPEPGMMDVAAVLCSNPAVEETHSLRLQRSARGAVLKASVVLPAEAFPDALMVKADLERKVRERFGVTRLDLRYELRAGARARWRGRAVFDQHMLN